MAPVTVALVLAALVAASTALGLLWKRSQGRVRGATGEAGDFAAAGAAATLVQFSTEVCAPCAATRRVLERVAQETAGVSHVDVDITHRPDLASRFNILQTPTTLIVDATGTVRARIGGAARPATVLENLHRILTTDRSAA
jgi:thiol-disulfide isomerase/thioredoxin